MSVDLHNTGGYVGGDSEHAGAKRGTTDARKILRERQQMYRRLFNQGSEDGRALLADLKRFCRGGETAYHADPRRHCLLTGRQEVWWRINDHLTLTEDELVEKYTGTHNYGY